MDKTPKNMSQTLDTMRKMSQEEIDEMNKWEEQRDEIDQLYDAIEHYESDLRYHTKQVRCDTTFLEGEIKRILKERGDI